MTEPQEQGRPKLTGTRTGRVTSTGGEKRIRVVVSNLVKHRKYGKYIRRSTKLAVHDPKDQAEVGDTVEIAPCRPMSKMKRWRLIRVVRRAEGPLVGLQAGDVETGPDAREAPPEPQAGAEQPVTADAAPPAGDGGPQP